MRIIELQKKWSELSENNKTSGFKSLRISSNCIPDIFIGVNKDLNRCLILVLPKEYNFTFQGIIKENIKIEFFNEQNIIVLQLIDNTYFDLFDDLIISLYYRIEKILDVNKYTHDFITSFYRWSEFFEDKISDLLSENIVKGLFGELLVLKLLIKDVNSTEINDVLLSWKGPYDSGHDFELNNANLEVKTKDILKLDIRISSEFQLENELGKSLELVVVSVENNKDGLTIKDLVKVIRTSIIEARGDSAILLKALRQKGITFKNIQLYDCFRYKPMSKITYNSDAIDFPKLIKSNIPKEVNNLSYNIRTSALEEYIISKIDLQNGN